MIENYPKINIRYDQVDDVVFIKNKPFILAVEWKGVLFEFLIRLKEDSSNVIIFGSGAGAKQEHPLGPPYFQRHSWMNEFEDSVIYYNDPTLYLGSLSLGWGQGTKERFYLKDISSLLAKLLHCINVAPEKVLFYGSSGGGFMSLFLAGYLKGATALVNNPQTCLTKWLKTPVRNVFALSYPGLSEEEVLKTFPERINILRFFHHLHYVPPIYYLQNAACEFDITNHLIPFIEGLKNMNDDCVVNEVKVFLNYNKSQGHGALGKHETIAYINQAPVNKPFNKKITVKK
ncbi:glycosyl transferase family 2 [Priestia megaterium]|nr:glycosyl transferase family 2 [Priestia megaterium]